MAEQRTIAQNGFVEDFRNRGPNKCPVDGCGRVFEGQGVYAHLRKVHNIWGGKTGRIRNDPRYKHRGRKPNTKAMTKKVGQEIEVYQPPAAPEPEAQPLMGLRFPANLRVGLGEDGSMWICEQVRSPRGH